MTLKVLVCGGRDFADRTWLFATLDALHAERPIALIIHGGASGADTLAKDWANARSVELWAFPVTRAEWLRFGRKAGPLRNQRMLDEGQPDLVVAFPGGTGTADMVRRAKAAKVETLVLQTMVPLSG